MEPQTFDSEAPALQDLARRGYRHNFNLSDGQQQDFHLELGLRPGRFRIHEVHRFEGDSNPDDTCVIYAIESDDGTKGVLVDAYGCYADSRVTELVRQLPVPPRR